MQHPDEGTIHAWLDGALGTEEARALEAHVAGCARCAAAVTEARGLLAASSRILSALDAVPGGVLPAVAPEADDDRGVVPVARAPRWRSAGWRAAAAIVLVGSVSWLATRSTQQARDSVALGAAPAVSSSAANAAAAEAPVAMRLDTAAQVAQPPVGKAARRPAKRAEEAGVGAGASVDAARPRVDAAAPPTVAAAPHAMPYVALRPTAVPEAAGAVPNAPVAAADTVAADLAERREQRIAGAVARELDATGSQLRAKVSAQSAGAGRTMLRGTASAPAPAAAMGSPVGCYTLALDAARSISDSARPVAPLIPGRIELAPEWDSVAGRADGDRRVLRAAVGATPFATGTRATWSMIGADSALLEVSEANRSLVARVGVKGDSIRGLAAVSGPSAAGGSAVTGIHGARIACTQR